MLSKQQIDDYRERGFLAVEGVLPGNLLEHARAVVDEFVEQSRSVAEHTSVYDLEPGHTPERPRVRRLKEPLTCGQSHCLTGFACSQEGKPFATLFRLGLHVTPKAVGEDAIWQGSVAVLTGQATPQSWMASVEKAAEANKPTSTLKPDCSS